jgi:hypothetical protein
MEFGFGSGLLTAVRNDIPNQTPTRFGALQDVTVDFDGEIKMLWSTQQFPIDSARGKVKITGKAKVAQISAEMYNSIFFGQTVSYTGSQNFAYNESTTLSTGAPTYTVANSASTPLQDMGVFYASNGGQLTLTTSAPGSAQYTFNPTTGVYAFSTYDASKGILVNYTYTQNSPMANIAIGNPFMGTTPRFQVTLYQPFENTQTVLQLYSCVSSRLTFPTRIDDYVIQDLDFSAFANAAGNVGLWSVGLAAVAQ